MTSRRVLTDRQLEKAKGMLARGHGFGPIGRHFGVGYATVRRYLDPEYAERQRALNRKFDANPDRKRTAPAEHGMGFKVSQDEVDERDRLAEAYARRGLSATVFGDPPPGYSSLDKKRRGITP